MSYSLKASPAIRQNMVKKYHLKKKCDIGESIHRPLAYWHDAFNNSTMPLWKCLKNSKKWRELRNDLFLWSDVDGVSVRIWSWFYYQKTSNWMLFRLQYSHLLTIAYNYTLWHVSFYGVKWPNQSTLKIHRNFLVKMTFIFLVDNELKGPKYCSEEEKFPILECYIFRYFNPSLAFYS